MLERINTTSLALMMPSGAVHSIIPGRGLLRLSKDAREPGIHNPCLSTSVPPVVMDSGLAAQERSVPE